MTLRSFTYLYNAIVYLAFFKTELYFSSEKKEWNFIWLGTSNYFPLFFVAEIFMLAWVLQGKTCDLTVRLFTFVPQVLVCSRSYFIHRSL
jgi:hypothetical protein